MKTKMNPKQMTKMASLFKAEVKRAKAKLASEKQDVVETTKDVADLNAELAEATRFLKMAKTGIRYGLKDTVADLRHELTDTKDDLRYSKEAVVKAEKELAKLLA